MALRSIRELGDPILEKECKEIKNVTERTRELIRDMLDTMYEANGVGLAAPQVGVLRRVFVIDIGDEKRYVCINPEVSVLGEELQTGPEGCLSVPGKEGTVTRPMRVHVKAKDIDFKDYEFEAEGLLARAVSHENDHLNGVMYTTRVEGELRDVVYGEAEGEEEQEEEEL